MRFKEYSFKSLLKVIIDNRGKTCPTDDTGIPLIATNCIKNDALYPVHEKVRYVDQETYQNWFRGHPAPGDMIFVCKGSPGRVCWVPDPVDFCIAQDMVAIRADDTKVYPKYLFALLRSEETQQKILNMHVGTLIPHFKKGDFGNLYFNIPEDMGYQKIVGDAYFKFCEKIHLNTQTNQTLESIALAIFKSWFVDFDPVNAKIAAKERWYAMQPTSESASPVCYADEAVLPDLETYTNLAAMCAISGKSETELAQLQKQNPDQYQHLAETAALFPSAMVDSELGEIPEGWEVHSYSDLCRKIESGGTPKRNEDSYWGGEVRWLSSGEVRDRVVIDTKERITLQGLNNSSAKLWPKYTIVIAMYGATAGEACLLAEEMCANQACCGLIPKEEYISFIYLTAIRSSQILSEKASGSAQQNLNKGIIEYHKLIAPPPKLANLFESSTKTMILKLIENYKQNAALAEFRDSLLPKLLSGEIDLSETESALTLALSQR